jgi:hypothetical protein
MEKNHLSQLSILAPFADGLDTCFKLMMAHRSAAAACLHSSGKMGVWRRNTLDKWHLSQNLGSAFTLSSSSSSSTHSSSLGSSHRPPPASLYIETSSSLFFLFLVHVSIRLLTGLIMDEGLVPAMLAVLRH